jgi:hypothetical protein
MHVVHVTDPDEVRRDVRYLERLVIRAFGPANVVEALDRMESGYHLGRGEP